jgi:hypothetical protein
MADMRGCERMSSHRAEGTRDLVMHAATAWPELSLSKGICPKILPLVTTMYTIGVEELRTCDGRQRLVVFFQEG